MSTDAIAHEMPRLKKQYREQIRAAMQEEFGYRNPMLIPGLEKIVVNMGVGDAAHDSKVMDGRHLRAQSATSPPSPVRSRRLLRLASPSLSSSCARDSRSAATSPFAGTACGSLPTVC